MLVQIASKAPCYSMDQLPDLPHSSLACTIARQGREEEEEPLDQEAWAGLVNRVNASKNVNGHQMYFVSRVVTGSGHVMSHLRMTSKRLMPLLYLKEQQLLHGTVCNAGNYLLDPTLNTKHIPGPFLRLSQVL